MNARALITGADGFVGRVLAEHLTERGWDARGCVLPPAPEAGDVFGCDVSDPAQVDALMEWAGPVTHVFHLAAITFLPVSQSDPAHTMDVNLGGTIRLIHAVRSHAPKARILHVGSAAAYGVPRSLPITEEHPLQPNEPYAISKAAADAYCDYACRNDGVEILRVRPFNHTGGGQSDQFVLPSFARQIARIRAGLEEPVIRVGNLDVARDFLHVRDVVKAYELLARLGKAGHAYNVCSGASQSVHHALERLQELAETRVRIEVDPERVRRVEIPEVRGSHDKITLHTGWEPSIRFEAVLRELLDYWCERESKA